MQRTWNGWGRGYYRGRGLRTWIAVPVILGGLALIGIGAAPSALAFSRGTGHPNITRVLSCGATNPVADCFQAGSMTMLAGPPGGATFTPGKHGYGAVSAADTGVGIFVPAAHCDNADHNVIRARIYFQTKAKAHANLRHCISEVDNRLSSAVGLAASLLPDLRRDTVSKCNFNIPLNYKDLNPKCSVINQLGRAMHTAQDFYAHSNWTDARIPGQKLTFGNPPGLGRTDLPNFFNFTCGAAPSGKCAPPAVTIPGDLITGCALAPVIEKLKCVRRIDHGALNKDNGTINPVTGTASNPETSRGKITFAGVTNYQRAVTGARAQTRQIWIQFVAALKVRYPGSYLAMVRALSCDTPWDPATCLGAPATGGGSTAGVADPVLSGVGGAAVLAGAGLLGFSIRRRAKASQG